MLWVLKRHYGLLEPNCRCFVQLSHPSVLESGVVLGRGGLICLSPATRRKGRRKKGNCDFGGLFLFTLYIKR